MFFDVSYINERQRLQLASILLVFLFLQRISTADSIEEDTCVGRRPNDDDGCWNGIGLSHT